MSRYSVDRCYEYYIDYTCNTGYEMYVKILRVQQRYGRVYTQGDHKITKYGPSDV